MSKNKMDINLECTKDTNFILKQSHLRMNNKIIKSHDNIKSLKKLEKSGLLAGSKFIINPKVLGYTTMAFVGVYLDFRLWIS